jgi:polysulfide reductase-like protein
MSSELNIESTPQAVPVGYGYRPVTKVPNWHGLVTWDILLNNLSTGLFIAAALGELTAPASYRALADVAYPVALLLLAADLVCLVLDLGDAWRFHHMLRIWKPSSPMSLGTWALTAYSVPLTLLALMSFLPAGLSALEWARPVLLVTGSVLALAAAAYKGVLFSTTAQPGWRHARWLGGYLTNSALVLGTAELMLLGIVLGSPAAAGPLRSALMLLLILNLVVLSLVLVDLRASLARAHTPRVLGTIGALAVVAGLIVPLGLLALGTPAAAVAAVLLIFLGAVVVRSEIVQLPHLLANTAPVETSSAR